MGRANFVRKLYLWLFGALERRLDHRSSLLDSRFIFFKSCFKKFKLSFQVTAETSSFKPNFFVRNLITNEEESFEDNYKLEVLNGEWLREKTDSEGRTILHIPNFQEFFLNVFIHKKWPKKLLSFINSSS